ncbi:MAG: T9SS type A sorting domain-containing protein [Ignavibacteriaceae bacterium]|nr:T9SS type A sorting domain-containing protein [Ignavibacteriaceae bacterium]
MSRIGYVLLFLLFIANIAIAQNNASNTQASPEDKFSDPFYTPPLNPVAGEFTGIVDGTLNSVRYNITLQGQEVYGKSFRVYSTGLLMKSGNVYDINTNAPSVYFSAYKYNTEGKVIEVVSNGIQKTLSFYFPNGKLKEVWMTDMMNDPFQKSFYSYDVNGLLSEVITQRKNGQTWNDSYKYVYQYNSNNLLLSSYYQLPGATPGNWTNYSVTNYTYNPMGLVETRTRQYLSGGSWVNSQKYYYIYNTSSLVSEDIYYQWSNAEWLPIYKTQYEYDANLNPYRNRYYDYTGINQWTQTGVEDFTINTDPSLKLIQPLANTYHTPGVMITWFASQINAVDIYFSNDAGQNWTLIAPSVPDTGNFSFYYLIPNNVFTSKAKIKVTAAGNQNIYDMNDGTFWASSISFQVSNIHLMKQNRLWLPMDNKGVLADVTAGGVTGGVLDGKSVIFSSGFFLSGLHSDIMWANGVLSASRIEDYDEGLSSGNNPIFLGDRNYGDYSFYWQNWRNAVVNSAGFYDGNNDGEYEPIDLNSNGVWDANEDRPDFLGDESAWCFYTDRVPSALRRYNDVEPKGIEVRQTVFATSDTSAASRGTIFVRYNIRNNGTVAQLFDSVYFSAASDPDIGDYNDDYVGCDTLLNMGYGYQKTPDAVFGANPPAFGIDILQGPHAYIPGKSFIDNNSNGVYDPGTDTPLDTAYLHKGPFIGKVILPGAMNLGMTSFTQYMQSHPTHGDPNTRFELRNYQLGGRGKQGDFIDPCTWSFGTVTGVNCSLVNKNYMYSGDPLTNTGWINNTGIDQRFMINSGPFRLKVGEPVEIWLAYSVARGTSPLNSLTLLKQENQFIQQLFDNNFENLPLSVKDGELSGAPGEFLLLQNYPNPFNPSTIIKYAVGGVKGSESNLNVTLRVFDILGREVAALVNESKAPGYYSVTFDASKLTSGVYFYQLKAGSFTETKKLMLVR